MRDGVVFAKGPGVATGGAAANADALVDGVELKVFYKEHEDPECEDGIAGSKEARSSPRRCCAGDGVVGRSAPTLREDLPRVPAAMGEDIV